MVSPPPSALSSVDVDGQVMGQLLARDHDLSLSLSLIHLLGNLFPFLPQNGH